MQRLLTLTFVLILPAVSGCLLNGQRTWGGYRGDPCGCATYSQSMPAYGSPGYGSNVGPQISTELPGPIGIPGPVGTIQASPSTYPST